jgi:phosphatidylglycerol---prolipoprotein diacylglyceryl transferase
MDPMNSDLSRWYHHDLNPIAFTVGSWGLPWYWITYVLGWVVCAWFCYRYDRKVVGFIDRTQLFAARDEFLLWGWVGLMTGARLAYIVVYNPNWYWNHPAEIPALWNGGMSFHGGFVGIILAAYVVSRRRNIDFYLLTDPVAVIIPWILIIGRVSNFLNGELPGRVTTVPWAVVFPPPFDGAPRHPSQLYEAVTEGLVVGLILLLARKKWSLRPGLLSLGFTGMYAGARFLTEFTREPDPQIGLIAGFTIGQWLCVGMMLLVVYTLTYRGD